MIAGEHHHTLLHFLPKGAFLDGTPRRLHDAAHVAVDGRYEMCGIQRGYVKRNMTIAGVDEAIDWSKCEASWGFCNPRPDAADPLVGVDS
ncbi:hypothetical protein PT974_06082 [Cladobotryum mycophilum]|uniref:Uncharacterized protein n=1 Tax=Cladobotryum mycophilum TaxID=491253 RepID=A0ABR0SKI5_9HYPO